MLDNEAVHEVLVVTAHPDDLDFGAAGTIAGFTDAGAHVTYCVVTDGNAGGFDPNVPRIDIAGIRRDEQTAAAAVLGVTDLIFLGYPDGELQVTLELRRDIAEVIRQVRPDLVMIQSAERDYDRIYASHPDHRAVGEAALCAVYPDARNPFAPHMIMSAREAHTVPVVWIMGGATRVDHVVDITDNFDRKMQALLCHDSQHPERETLEERIRSWNERVAIEGNLPAGRLAEGYQVVDTL